jgi:ferritin-like metal-binding protein YciE
VTLRQLLIKDLQDMLQSEGEQARRLPALASLAQTGELKSALEEHLAETNQQIQRIRDILERLGQDPGGTGEVPESVRGLNTEVEKKLGERLDPLSRDFLLVILAQKLEHMEISCYGSARAMAHTLGLMQEAGLLADSLREEKLADERLNRIGLTILKDLGQAQAA